MEKEERRKKKEERRKKKEERRKKKRGYEGNMVRWRGKDEGNIIN
jgi:hypothetical protein